MNEGIKNEFDFINTINNSKFKNLNPLLQDFILHLFPNIDNNDIVYAKKYGRYAKADFVITVGNIKKGISVKFGYKNSVHVEHLDKFEKKLESYGISSYCIDQLKRYIYADGTNNNTGEIRLSNQDYLLKHCYEVSEINKCLVAIKKELIKRFLIETDINYRVSVDAFIHGTVNDFLWITSEEALSFLNSVENNSNSLHISNLFIQSWDKNLNRNYKYEHCRDYIQVKWFSMYDDIIKIINNRYLNM